MKIKFKHLLFLVLFFVAMLKNPGFELHQEALLQGMDQMYIDENQYILNDCKYYNYGLISFVGYLGTPLSVGFLGNVLVFYSNLDGSLKDYQYRKSLGPEPQIIH